jgi:hypothetical protein
MPGAGHVSLDEGISIFLYGDAGWEDLVDKGDLGGNATKIVELNEHAR